MTPYLHSIYCDDIRMEVGDKLTLVGIYTGDLVVKGDLPSVLPKLCIQLTYTQPRELAAKEKLTFSVLKGDKTIAELAIPASELEAQRRALSPSATHLAVNVSIILSPFEIDEECSLKPRVQIDDEDPIKGRSLKIVKGPADQPSA
jgi:hypothetical protein